jgi:hypothetical protein
LPAPATRTWRFFGDVFSDTPGLDVTITFNGIVIHDGAISANYLYHDYHNRWDEIMASEVERRLLCQTELAYSTTGLLPLKIKVNSDGVLNFAWVDCNYTSSYHTTMDPLIAFASSCDRNIDNKRNIKINKDIIDVAPLGWSYHITKESEFHCDIFMDPRFSAWIPGNFASALRENLRTRF